MLNSTLKIMVMKDILQRPEQPETIKSFITKLHISKKDKEILINKYSEGIVDKIQIKDLNVSPRYYYKLLQDIHIRAYNAMKAKIRE